MALEQKDIESIEFITHKMLGNITVSVARSFERFEERMDAAESRIHSRLAEVEDKLENSRQDLSDELGVLRDSVREIARSFDQPGDVDPLQEV